jgi:hypothetical protein
MTRLAWAASVTVIAACAPGEPADDAGDDLLANRCIVASAAETIEVELVDGKPASTLWSRSGTEYSRWTYAYDELGRLLREEQDTSGTSKTLDGVSDIARTFEHTPSSVIESVFIPPGAAEHERITYTLDANDRVVRQEGPTWSAAFSLDADGRIVREETRGIDPEAGPYSMVTDYRYDGGLLAEQTRTDSRLGDPPRTFTFENEALPGQLVVSVAYGIYRYSLDDEGRMTVAEVDEDRDGTSDWIVEATYAEDGAITIVSSREGSTFRTVTYSAACDVVLAVPRPLTYARPAPHWNHLGPGIPQPYF